MTKLTRSIVLAAFVLVLILTEAALLHADDNKGGNNNNNNQGKNKGGDGNDHDDNGEGKNKGDGDDKGNEKDKDDDYDGKDYDELAPSEKGEERCSCKAKGPCYGKVLVCPNECPERKPKQNKRKKGCFVKCGNKCEATCKYRKPNCDGYGSLCYDPRFVGGDGVMFYFHGAKDGNFAIVSDENLQINAHMIGTRPQGRTRDFTWVQALAVMFDSHTLLLAANKVSHWDGAVDSLTVRFDGEDISIPTDDEWTITSSGRTLSIERTDEVNSVKVKVTGLVEIDARVRPIGKEENKVHNYQIPANDAFAHLETQFKFSGLSESVEGVLGKTYQPEYVSPVKKGVPMPIMGGEDKYQTASLFSTTCKACKFNRPSQADAESSTLASI